MKQAFQITLLGLALSLLLCGSATSADTQMPKNSDVEYHYYKGFDPEGQKYYDFFPAPASEKHLYYTVMKASANIDNTPEIETVVLIVADTNEPPFDGKWAQAFLIIAEAETEAALPKKRDLCQGTHYLKVGACASSQSAGHSKSSPSYVCST